MGILNFLKSKSFFMHLGIAILSVILLIWLTIQVLKFYTQHGDEYEVQDFTGIQYENLSETDMKGDFQFIVIDSVYDDHFNKGEVVLQDPLPGSKVKSGRKIYITIVASQPEMVLMPNLVDLSLRQALNELKAHSLKLEKLEFVTNFAKNAVLAQRIEGDTIEAGTNILKGTPVELVLGKGLDNEKIEVPFLIGMTETEAIKKINTSSLNVGYLKYLDGRDKIHSRVYEQQPRAIDNTKVEFGTYIDLWFRNELYYNFDSLKVNYANDSIVGYTKITEKNIDEND
jgi:eukaryotic-like serine/threonine-protein kinase